MDSRKSSWLHGIYRGFNKHKRKVAFAVLVCFLFIFFRLIKFNNASQDEDLTVLSQKVLSKAKAPRAQENENLEEELNDSEWKEYNYSSSKPKSVKNAIMAILQCLIEENKGIMDRRCIKQFKQWLPKEHEKKVELVQCAVESFQQCTKRPKDHQFSECMQAFKSCLLRIEHGL